MSEAAPTLQAGQRLLGRYELESLLGQGGFGVVWRARQLATGQPVAIKILHRAGALPGEEADRFARELSLVATLHHPHIVRLIDSGTLDDGAPFMALEYLRGDTLAARIARGPLPPRVALRLMTHTLEALRHAHQHGVIHRDFKPHNVMVTGDARPSAVVLDFGVSSLTETAREADYKNLTAAHQLLGTPAYMAPEQVDRRGDLTPAADLYAWGLVLLECLTGQPAAGGDSLMATLLWQMSASPTQLPDALLGSPLGDLIAKAVAKPLHARYADADAILSDLEALDLGALPQALLAPSGIAGASTFVSADTAAIDAAQMLSAPVHAAEFEVDAADLDVATEYSDVATERSDVATERSDVATERSAVATERSDVATERSAVATPRLPFYITAAVVLGAALIWALWPTSQPMMETPSAAPSPGERAADATPSAVAPDTTTPAPDTSAAAPDTSAAAPDTSAAAPDTTPLALAAPPTPAGMVWVPPGIVTMGLGEPPRALFTRLCEEAVRGQIDCNEDFFSKELPAHRLRFSEGFFIDKVEVSVARYRACVLAGACSPPRPRRGSCDPSQMTWDMPDGDDLPINCVDWHQADRFCAWQGSRLPFEDEWEYAARAATGRAFPWGNDMPGCALAALGGEACRLDKPSPVGTWPLDVSPFGALDMGGNLIEWTSSEHDPYPSDGPIPALRRAPSQPTGSYRICKGGSWMVPALGARATIRIPAEKDATFASAGFRCVRDVP